MLKQPQHIYIPQNERILQHVQRKVSELDRQTRAWADSVVRLLPNGISLLDDEIYLLSLYLAQQRRLNLEMDAQNKDETLRSRLSRLVPSLLPENGEDDDVLQAVHRMVATRIESDIERATDFFCRDHDLPGLSDLVIDWRVRIRFLAQQLHRIASQINLKSQSALALHRFELTLTARELAAEVADRRRIMLKTAPALEAK